MAFDRLAVAAFGAEGIKGFLFWELSNVVILQAFLQINWSCLCENGPVVWARSCQSVPILPERGAYAFPFLATLGACWHELQRYPQNEVRKITNAAFLQPHSYMPALGPRAAASPQPTPGAAVLGFARGAERAALRPDPRH